MILQIVNQPIRITVEPNLRGFSFGINKTFNVRDQYQEKVNGSYLRQFGVSKWEQF